MKSTFSRMAVLLSAAIFFIGAASTAHAALGKPPEMRLGDAVRPLAYELALTLKPSEPRFVGHVAIDVELTKATDGFWLNATALQINRAVLHANGKAYPARIVAGGKDFAGLQFATRIPAGKARVEINYRGSIADNETRGLFRQQDGGNWYLFSQFESISARRAFPSFDEPQWKTPWTLSLTVPREQVAVANTEVVAEENTGKDMKTVRFAPTLPLPTYLVAVGVGPFEIVDGGTAGKNRTHLRYIVPKGRSGELRYAVEATPRLLTLLEDYFGRPYPFSKLDSMAIPLTVGFGAMENAGLITYRAGILMSPPEREDERFRQRYANVGAHEMAHQWFGNLVTMEWWTDIWLNESFATWMARKVVGQFHPAWDANDTREQERMHAMQTDRLAATRQIRQPVEHKDDLANAFDSITYDKGGAVLTMFDTLLGEEGFRDGVRRYLKQHEFGNASAEDFFTALAGADAALAKGFASFVEQPGVPRVTVDVECGQGAALHVRQERFLPGAKAQANRQSWSVPLCVRHEGQAGEQPFCTVLNAREQLVPLPQAASCPAWVLSNPGGNGYYLSAIDPARARALSVQPLKEIEVVALLDELSLQTASGTFPADALLDIAGHFANDVRPATVKAAAEAVMTVVPLMAADAGTRAQLAAWVVAHFGQRAVDIGWVPRQDDTDATQKMRAVLLPLVADIGGDAALRKEARQLALTRLSGDGAALGSMARIVLKSAAYSGDAALFDAMAQAVLASNDSNARLDIYRAMGAFRDEGLRQRAFAFALGDKADIREADQIFETAGSLSDNAPALQQFLQANFLLLQKRLPESALAHVPHWGSALCEAGQRDAFAAFMREPAGKTPGGARNLEQTLESIDICVAARATQGGRLAAFLRQ